MSPIDFKEVKVLRHKKPPTLGRRLSFDPGRNTSPKLGSAPGGALPKGEPNGEQFQSST